MEMDDAEESAPTVRRTRSGKVVKQSPAKAKASPKPATRRTRKKVVVTEVEDSDEEDEAPLRVRNDTDNSEKSVIDQTETEIEEVAQSPESNKGEKDILSFLDDNSDNKLDNIEHDNNLESDENVLDVEINSIPQFIDDTFEEAEKAESLNDEAEEEEEVSEKVEDELMETENDEINENNDIPEELTPEKMEEEAEDNKPNKEPFAEDKTNEKVDEINDAEEEKLLADEEMENNASSDEESKNKPEKLNGVDSLSDNDSAFSTDTKDSKQNGDPDAENISEDELPGVPVAKVPETEEVSDEELPGPKRAELPADTEVVSEDELPSVKKESTKRKIDEGDYDPGSPTSETEVPTKKPALEADVEVKEEKPSKPKKLPELDKYWKAVNDDPTDFTGWTYLLQYVDQENDMEAAREAYDAFLSHYPYCYGYWRKYADYEKRKGNKKKCEEVFERGLKAIPLSVDLWIHYLTYVKTTRPEDEDYIRSQFERAITSCGLEFRSDRLWDSYIKWETEAKRLQHVTAIYDRLLATPTQGYTAHFDNFQEHISSNSPNKVVEVDEFLALRKEVRHMLKHDVTTETPAADNADAPPGDEDPSKLVSSDEETKSIRERIVSIRRKIHKNTVNAVTARWNFEEGIKRPYFHVKPLERCQLKNWQDYLDYEIEQGDRGRIVVLFERCLIACALYEEFWLKFVHFLEGLKDVELQSKVRDVYERACTIHHLKKPSLHLQWAMFEESVENYNRAAEILVNLEKSVPNVLQVAYRRINLERRRGDNEKCTQFYEHYINNSKNKMISSNIAIKFSRFCLKVLKDMDKAQEVLKAAIGKDPNNPRLTLQLIDLTLQKDGVTEGEIIELIDSFLDKEGADADQKVLFSQRKLEFLEDFGTDITSVQTAYEQYQKHIKQSKESTKKKETKSDSTSANKKEKSATQASSQSSSYGSYGNYGSNSSSQASYPYSGSQQGQYNYSQYGQGDQYQYQNWQYPQGSYPGYNQWGSYSGGYGY